MSALAYRGMAVPLTAAARASFVDEEHGGDAAAAAAALADDVRALRAGDVAPLDLLARRLAARGIDPDDDARARGRAEYVDAVVDAAIRADEADRRAGRGGAGARWTVNRDGGRR